MDSGLGYFEGADPISAMCKTSTVSRSEQGHHQGQRSQSCENNASGQSTSWHKHQDIVSGTLVLKQTIIIYILHIQFAWIDLDMGQGHLIPCQNS